jgi:hypothetical protein
MVHPCHLFAIIATATPGRSEADGIVTGLLVALPVLDRPGPESANRVQTAPFAQAYVERHHFLLGPHNRTFLKRQLTLISPHI